MYPPFSLSFFCRYAYLEQFSKTFLRLKVNKVFAKSLHQSILNASLQPIAINILSGLRKQNTVFTLEIQGLIFLLAPASIQLGT